MWNCHHLPPPAFGLDSLGNACESRPDASCCFKSIARTALLRDWRKTTGVCTTFHFAPARLIHVHPALEREHRCTAPHTLFWINKKTKNTKATDPLYIPRYLTYVLLRAIVVIIHLRQRNVASMFVPRFNVHRQANGGK